jgi:hypothetical protein
MYSAFKMLIFARFRSSSLWSEPAYGLKYQDSPNSALDIPHASNSLTDHATCDDRREYHESPLTCLSSHHSMLFIHKTLHSTSCRQHERQTTNRAPAPIIINTQHTPKQTQHNTVQTNITPSNSHPFDQTKRSIFSNQLSCHSYSLALLLCPMISQLQSSSSSSPIIHTGVLLLLKQTCQSLVVPSETQAKQTKKQLSCLSFPQRFQPSR